MKTIPLKKFKKFLKDNGCYLKRTKSSHEIWDSKVNPLERPVIVDNNYPDVPITHIHTCLKILKISKKDFEEKIKKI